MSSEKMAKIITVFNQKGGAGKTTSACQLAGTLGHRGYDVLVADLDPQQTAGAWLGTQGGANFPATLWSGFRYRENTVQELAKLAPKYDIIVVDCAPAVDQPGTWSALLVSDLGIIPTKLGPSDTGALPATVKLAQRALETAQHEYPIRILPVAYRKSRQDDNVAIEQIASHPTVPGITLMKAQLGDRIAFSRSMLYGATVHSMPNAKDAVAEADVLADEVCKLLKIPARKKKD